MPGTVRVLSARMNYFPSEGPRRRPRSRRDACRSATPAYVSRYALGRDYHKVLRNALQGLADDIVQRIGAMGYRVFVDSGPVLEKALARKAGVGWIGKHTNLIARDAGSYFFIGEILTDLPLPVDEPASAHCGSCSACIPACPTGAITAPYQLDARRCISYLTIELHGAIPVELRRSVGQSHLRLRRLPAGVSVEQVRARRGASGFQGAPCDSTTRGWPSCSAGPKQEFLQRTEGSAIRRIGYERWLRNIAVALGNAPATQANLAALDARREDPSALVREHVEWALADSRRAAALRSEQASNCRLSMRRALPSRAAVSTANCRVSGCASPSVRASRTLK